MLRSAKFFLLLPLFLVAGYTYLSLSKEKNPTFSRLPKSIGEPRITWDHAPISVCWGLAEHLAQTSVGNERLDVIRKFLINPDMQLRESIRSVIASQYVQEDLGISFSNWQTCKENVDSDVVIGIAHDPAQSQTDLLSDLTYSRVLSGESSMGQSGILDEINGWSEKGKGKPAYVYLKLWNFADKMTPIQKIQLTALHEFGHLAGLIHEHVRYQAKSDPNCIEDNFGIGQIQKTTEFFSTYDPNSVMNYCFIHTLIEHKIGLHFLSYSLWFPFPPNEKSVPSLRSGNFQLIDPSLFRVENRGFGRTEYWINPGLSVGDKHTLRCLYKYTAEQRTRICHPDYDPIQTTSHL